MERKIVLASHGQLAKGLLDTGANDHRRDCI